MAYEKILNKYDGEIKVFKNDYITEKQAIQILELFNKKYHPDKIYIINKQCEASYLANVDEANKFISRKKSYAFYNIKINAIYILIYNMKEKCIWNIVGNLFHEMRHIYQYKCRLDSKYDFSIDWKNRQHEKDADKFAKNQLWRHGRYILLNIL